MIKNMSLCRLCMENTTNVVTEFKQSDIQNIFNFTMKDIKNYPKVICEVCFDNILAIKQMIEKAHSSETELRKRSETIKSKKREVNEHDVIDEIPRKRSPKKYICDFCGYQMDYKNELTQHLHSHLRTKQNAPVIKCKLCRKSFRTEMRLKLHHRQFHFPHCPDPKPRFSARLTYLDPGLRQISIFENNALTDHHYKLLQDQILEFHQNRKAEKLYKHHKVNELVIISHAQSFHRGLIKKKNLSTSLVQLVDYGYTETIRHRDIFRYHMKLRHMPAYIYTCFVSNFEEVHSKLLEALENNTSVYVEQIASGTDENMFTITVQEEHPHARPDPANMPT